mmetsp:Transcript_16227/g.33338  ORF Transcript_16227/g.33338 Transcript_16227/m.33338 type:complete len:974 (+) Transcript_16227:194-3115(+)
MHRQSIEHRVDERTPTPPPTHESSFVSDWPISSIPFTPYVFAGSKGGVLAGNMKDLGLYNVYDGSSVASSAVDSNGEVTTIGVSGCGTFVFTGSSDGKVRKWVVGALSIDCVGESQRLGDDWIERVSISPGLPNSRDVVGVLTKDNCVYMLDGDGLEIISSRKAPNLHKNGVECFAVSSSGNNIVTSAARAKAKSQAFKLWTGKLEEVVKLKQPHMNVVQGVVFGPTSDDQFYSFANDCCIKVWSFSKKVCTKTIENAHYASISTLSFSRDGRYFLTTAMDNTLTMWNASTSKRRASCDSGEILSQAVFCGENDDRISTLSRAGRVMVWKETNPDRCFVDNSIFKDVGSDLPDPPEPPASDDEISSETAHASPRASTSILKRMTSAFRSSSKSIDSYITSSPKTPQASPQGMPPPPKGIPTLRHSATGAIAMPGLGLKSMEEISISEHNEGDGGSVATTALGEASSLELEIAQNQAYFVGSKNEKLLEQVETLKGQLYTKDMELHRKQEELNAANLRCQQLGQQWQAYHDQAVNETASRWRSHSESLEAEKQNEINANSSIRDEVETLKEEYVQFRQEKERILRERDEEIESMRAMLSEQEAVNDKRGFMDQMIFDILKGTKCMDVQYSLKQDEIRVGNLTQLVAEATENDYLSATQLLDSVKRHKSWEASERKKLCEDVRALILEREIDFAYKRHDTIRTMESLRDRTLQNCRDLASKVRSETTTAEVHKRKYHELVEEHIFVESKLEEAEECLNAERERLGQLTTAGHATLVHEAQSNIQDYLLEVEKWVNVKKDIYYTMKIQEDIYFKAMATRDKSKDEYAMRQRIYDEGIGQAFVSAIKIVSDADEVAAAEEFKKQMQKEKEDEKVRKEMKDIERRQRRKKELETEEKRRAEEEVKKGKPSPASLVGTHATWSRIRERMQGKYDFSFKDFVSKDGKLNRGGEPKLNRALFTDNARGRESGRKKMMERHK